MRVVFSTDHRLHSPQTEMHRGKVVPYYESPERVEKIMSSLLQSQFAELVVPTEFAIDIIQRVHSADYIQFLQSIYSEWRSEGLDGDILPHVWIGRSLNPVRPDGLFGRIGYYSFDAASPITSGTWKASLAGANIASTVAHCVHTTRSSAFGVTRPPGHHASRDVFGGYCFLNNAAIAAETFLSLGATRVAVLDLDYHHGNGTQSIFYDRNDVLFVSLHADPNYAYPYFSGYPGEIGRGLGEGFNLNLPLPAGTSWNQYVLQLTKALDRIAHFAPSYLVVSLGLDTFVGDPISDFKLQVTDFEQLGRELATLQIPSAILLEGGYSIDHLGVLTENFLTPLAH